MNSYKILYFRLVNDYGCLGLFPYQLVDHWGRELYNNSRETVHVRNVTIMEWNSGGPFYVSEFFTDQPHFLTPVKDTLSIYHKGFIIKQMIEWDEISYFIQEYLCINPTPSFFHFESIQTTLKDIRDDI